MTIIYYYTLENKTNYIALVLIKRKKSVFINLYLNFFFLGRDMWRQTLYWENVAFCEKSIWLENWIPKMHTPHKFLSRTIPPKIPPRSQSYFYLLHPSHLLESPLASYGRTEQKEKKKKIFSKAKNRIRSVSPSGHRSLDFSGAVLSAGSSLEDVFQVRK